MNNLNELNAVLFDTLRGVNSDKMQHKKATVLCNIGSTIINNAKVQLQASKLLKGGALETEFFGVIKSHEEVVSNKIGIGMKTDNLYDKKLEYALYLGYKSISEAMQELTKSGFEKDFNNFLNKDHD